MKPNEFFVDKAYEYVQAIEDVIPIFIPVGDRSFKPGYEAQQLYINATMLRVKLLFSEFDNGKFFTDQILDADRNPAFDLPKNGNKRLEAYVQVLELFIEYMDEY